MPPKKTPRRTAPKKGSRPEKAPRKAAPAATGARRPGRAAPGARAPARKVARKAPRAPARKAAPRRPRDDSLAAVLASQGGPRGIAPTRLLAEPRFLAELKPLFWRNQAREAPAYEGLLYNLDPPAEADGLDRLLAFRRVGPVPALGKAENAEAVQRVMRTIRYPDVEALASLARIEGMTLPALTTILHYHHPAYPIVSRDLVRGLNLIGYPVEYREDVGEESLLDYAGVIATLDRLKERVTFENVPESNCFLTRVLEGALVQMAREAPASRSRGRR